MVTDRRLICYISGPISKGDLVDNINKGTEAFVRLAKAGLAPITPMWSAYSKPCFRENGKVLCEGTITGNDQMSHSDWLQVDLAFVEVSDCVLRLPGESVGADIECNHAMKCNIPVFYTEAGVLSFAERKRKEVINGSRGTPEPLHGAVSIIECNRCGGDITYHSKEKTTGEYGWLCDQCGPRGYDI